MQSSSAELTSVIFMIERISSCFHKMTYWNIYIYICKNLKQKGKFMKGNHQMKSILKKLVTLAVATVMAMVTTSLRLAGLMKGLAGMHRLKASLSIVCIIPTVASTTTHWIKLKRTCSSESVGLMKESAGTLLIGRMKLRCLSTGSTIRMSFPTITTTQQIWTNTIFW